ncbi:hypothetical protein RLIN73S_02150 [Rhodanobacter lindaniclasticus]
MHAVEDVAQLVSASTRTRSTAVMMRPMMRCLADAAGLGRPLRRSTSSPCRCGNSSLLMKSNSRPSPAANSSCRFQPCDLPSGVFGWSGLSLHGAAQSCQRYGARNAGEKTLPRTYLGLFGVARLLRIEDAQNGIRGQLRHVLQRAGAIGAAHDVAHALDEAAERLVLAMVLGGFSAAGFLGRGITCPSSSWAVSSCRPGAALARAVSSLRIPAAGASLRLRRPAAFQERCRGRSAACARRDCS